jgi:hypothetical protein
VLLSKTNDNFDNPIRIENITYSACLLDISYGLEDLSEYYWKVQAIDEYGEVRLSPEIGSWVFKTNNTNPAFPGWIKGRVIDSETGKPLSEGAISISDLDFFIGSEGYYLGSIPAGTFNIVARANGYTTKSYNGIKISPHGLLTKNFALKNISPALNGGDLNKDGLINFKDSQTGLKVLIILPNDAYISEDVNGDGKIGLEDTIRIIQHMQN